MSGGLPDAELADLLEILGDGDPAIRTAGLQTLVRSPAADERLIAPLEELLADRTAVVVSVPPPLIGELRWLAAHALAATRRALAITDPVVLGPVPAPLDANGLLAAAEAAGEPARGGIEGATATYAELARRGALPTTELVIDGEGRVRRGDAPG